MNNTIECGIMDYGYTTTKGIISHIHITMADGTFWFGVDAKKRLREYFNNNYDGRLPKPDRKLCSYVGITV